MPFVNAILGTVKRAVVERAASRSTNGEVSIAHAGKVLFVVTTGAIRCVHCDRRLVPRMAEDMGEWSRGKSTFVREHLRCGVPRRTAQL